MARTRVRNRIASFVALSWGMLNHRAYRELPYAAAKAFPYFMGKVKISPGDPQRYCVEIKFPYGEARKHGFSSSTFSKAIKDLIRFGFIDPVDKGGLRGDGKSYNVFTLSHRWEKFGTDGFEQKSWECFFPRTKK